MPEVDSITIASSAFELRFPERDGQGEQGDELFEVTLEGRTRTLRTHDYAEIFAIPGLYERLFHDVLACASPRHVCGLLAAELRRAGERPEELAALDVGAGNGLVGAELARLGIPRIVGVDILPEAAAATARDRPDLYDAYHVVDLVEMPDELREELGRLELSCLTSVAALGFGDMPPGAFAAAVNIVAPGAWIAFNIKERFLAGDDDTGFSRLVRRMLDEGAIELLAQERYPHRLSIAGEPIHYVALAARKRADVPREWWAA